ncbi:heat shock protein 70 [Artemisia annua]|uniref:Heat shock protein 70 n=1 Tax=Artemisia annua TaxID=35608 RepID=A0A2U1P9J5_ARTAN|nr:heat shock protein 70 [Artemisia annua]
MGQKRFISKDVIAYHWLEPEREDREGFLAKLQDTEDWLYEDAEHETKGVYIAKLEELKKEIGNLSFDKDDNLPVEIVTAANIRAGGQSCLHPNQDPSRKMLLMPVEPFEPNKSCYVCSENSWHIEYQGMSKPMVWNVLISLSSAMHA